MADTGFKVPTTTGLNKNNWATPTNAYSLDGNFTTTPNIDNAQDYDGFGFDIPESATIVGIEFRITGKAASSSNQLNIQMYSVNADDSYVVLVNLSTTNTEYTFGGSSSLGGVAFVPSDFDESFTEGKFYMTSMEDVLISIDFIEIKVYYISPSISPSVSPSVSKSPSISPSISPSKSPSISPSISKSPSLSPSVSPSVSKSPSISPSISPSVSISPSLSPSISPSLSLSLSPSVSPSISISPSVSPSPSPCSEYQLNGVTIPRPKTLSREYIKLKTDYTSLTGKTSLDYSYIKEKYYLGWELLSKAEADNILSIVNLNRKVTFLVNADNFNIPLVNVIPYIKSKEYSIIGDNYYVSLMLELIEEDV